MDNEYNKKENKSNLIKYKKGIVERIFELWKEQGDIIWEVL